MKILCFEFSGVDFNFLMQKSKPTLLECQIENYNGTYELQKYHENFDAKKPHLGTPNRLQISCILNCIQKVS